MISKPLKSKKKIRTTLFNCYKTIKEGKYIHIIEDFVLNDPDSLPVVEFATAVYFQ